MNICFNETLQQVLFELIIAYIVAKILWATLRLFIHTFISEEVQT